MKLKYSFEAVEMGNEVVLVPVGSDANQVHGVIKMNKEGQEILEYLKEDKTKDQIVENLLKKYDNDRQTLADWVEKVLSVLRQADLIEE